MGGVTQLSLYFLGPLGLTGDTASPICDVDTQGVYKWKESAQPETKRGISKWETRALSQVHYIIDAIKEQPMLV